MKSDYHVKLKNYHDRSEFKNTCIEVALTIAMVLLMYVGTVLLFSF